MEEKYIDVLQCCRLFENAEKSQIPQIIKCLNAKVFEFSKNEAIFNEGDSAGKTGVILSGAVQIVKDDFYGNRSIIAIAGSGELFAEAYALAGVKSLPVSVIAAADCKILMLDCNEIISNQSPCKFHNLIINNFLKIVAGKNILLNERAEILAKRTTRAKVMAYLSSVAKKRNSSQFDIPFDRQGLADFLCVERSAMCAELGKMKREGIIDFNKNHFIILNSDEH